MNLADLPRSTVPTRRSPSRRRLPSRILTAVLALTIILVVVTIAFNLRTLFYDFNVREVVVQSAASGEIAGDRLDRVLIDHLDSFEYINSFDHVFERGGPDDVSAVTRLKKLSVDRCEVRQGDFYRFMQWQKSNFGKPIAATMQPSHWVYRSSNRDHAISGRLQAPANGVSYYDAYAYCKAVGGRLPFREEWIAIAAGHKARLYPWGDEFNEFNWPYLDPLLNATQRCGLHKETDTAEGVHDLGGVVSEWAQNRETPLKPTIHGGNAYNQPRAIYSLNPLFRYAPPEYRSPYVGFRCVYEKTPRATLWKTPLQTVQIKPGDYPTGIPADARLPSLLVNLPRKQLYILKRLFRTDDDQTEKRLLVMEREVTRKQYLTFLHDPLVRLGLYADKNEPEDHDYHPANWQQQSEQLELPVTGVNWWSAHAFASWAGGRLPTADEWLAVASGRGRSVYPWGDEFQADNAVTGEAELRSAKAAGAAPNDVTADGILDMAGNVSEWTQSTDVSDGSYIIITKGGNYLLPGKETARIDFKNAVPPNHHSPALGLRVVFDQRL